MINRLIKNVRASEAIRHSFILTAGTVVAQMIPLLFMLLLTRFYSNASFGVYQLFYQLTVVFGVVAAGRLEQPVLSVKDDMESGSLAQAATKLSVYFCGVSLVLAGIFHLLFPANKIVVTLGAWLWLLPLSILLNANTVLLSYRLNRVKQYRYIVIGKIGLVFLANAIPAAGIVLHWNGTGFLLVAGFLLGQISGVWYSGKKLHWQWPASFRFSFTDRVQLRRYKSFLLYAAPANLIDMLAAAFPLLFIAARYGPAATGDMGFAQRILIVPGVFIASSVSQVFFKQASDHSHSGKNLFAFTLKTFGILLLIGLVPYGGVILFGRQLLPLIFGRQWVHASQLAQIMAYAMIVKFAVSPVSVVMTIVNRIKLQALWQIIALVTNLLLALVAWKWFDIRHYIITLTIMDLGLYLLYLFLILYSTKKAGVHSVAVDLIPGPASQV